MAARIKKGDAEARTRLVEANLRFVITIARQYENRGLPLEDLIGAGNLGLIVAAERFDGTRGFRFISFAVWWIRQAVQRTLKDHSQAVRLPSHRVDLLQRIYRCMNVNYQGTSRWPDVEEIAEELGISLEMVQDTLATARHTVSLDAAFGEEDTGSLMAMIADETEKRPDAVFVQNSLREEIGAAVGSLDERESEVIRLYYGLDGTPSMNLTEIGVRFGLTRERIRQIREKALRRLRNPKRSERLIPYADEV